MEFREVPVYDVLIRDHLSGLLVGLITAGWFFIGSWALLGNPLRVYGPEVAKVLPDAMMFLVLSGFSVVAGIGAWLRFRFVYRTLSTSHRTTGKLTRLKGKFNEAQEFEFDHEGTTYRVVNETLGDLGRHVGDTVEIVYDPACPTRAYLWDEYVPTQASHY